jgi:hypothetical protein
VNLSQGVKFRHLPIIIATFVLEFHLFWLQFLFSLIFSCELVSRSWIPTPPNYSCYICCRISICFGYNCFFYQYSHANLLQGVEFRHLPTIIATFVVGFHLFWLQLLFYWSYHANLLRVPFVHRIIENPLWDASFQSVARVCQNLV